MKISDGMKLTQADKRVLQVAIDPLSLELNITQRCKKAKVSRDTWYKAFKKPGFVDLVNELALAAIKSNVADLLNATMKYAIEHPRCSNDRKVLLTVLGFYTDKHEINGALPTTVTDDALEEELAKEKQ